LLPLRAQNDGRAAARWRSGRTIARRLSAEPGGGCRPKAASRCANWTAHKQTLAINRHDRLLPRQGSPPIARERRL